MPQQIGWSVEAKLLYEIKQLTKSLASRTYIQVFPNFASFPNPGITGTLYVDEATGDIYVWNGTGYVILSSGITALNGLIAAAQLFATGSTGTDFNISSVGTTHTFNIPTASATNRGLLSSADWTTFNSKIGGTGTTNYVSKFTASGTLGNSQIFDNGTNVGIGTASAAEKLVVSGLTNTRPTILLGPITTRTNLYGGFNSQETPAIEINANTATGFAGLSMTNTNTTSGATLGSISFAAAGTSGSEKRGALFASSLEGSAASSVTANLQFYTTNAGTVGERLRITPTGDIGIGTSSPEAILHVAKASAGGLGAQLVLDNTAASTLDNNVEISFLVTPGASGTGTRNARLIVNNESAVNGAANIQFHTYNGSSSGERMRITSAGDVGIGTTSPVNIGSATGLTINGSGASFLQLQRSAVNALQIAADANGSDIYEQRTGYMRFGTSNTERLRITSGGDVGIGTTTPGSILDVRSSGYNIIRSTGGNGGYFDAYNTSGTRLASFGAESGGDVYFGSRGSSPVIAITNSTERLRIFANGRIGINTTTDAGYQLDVNGTLRSVNGANFATTSGNVGVNTASPVMPFQLNNFGGFDGNSNQLIIRNNVYYNNTNARSEPIQNGYQTQIEMENLDGKIRFSTSSASNNVGTAASLVERMRITNTGNVGIGTTSPSEKLHIYGAGNQAIFVENTGTYQNYFGLSSNIGYVGSSNGTPFYIQTNGSARLYVDTSGNVGIGTTSPSEKLDVIGFMRTTSGVKVTDGTIDFRLSWASGNVGFFGTITNHPIDFYTNAAQRMRISAAGEILIAGTYNPLAAAGRGNITLNGTTDNIIAFTNNTTTTGYIFHGGTEMQIYNAANGNMRFFTNSLERMRITAGGDVGIGTSSPSARLQVEARSDSDIELLRLYRVNVAGTDDHYLQIYADVTNNFIRYNSTGNNVGGHAWFNSGTERMRITPGGNVLIGTTTDSGQKLYVNGDFRNDGDILVRGTYNPYAAANRGVLQLNGTNGNLVVFSNNTTVHGYINCSSTLYEILATGTQDFDFYQNSALTFKLTSNSNFGIRQTTFGTSATRTLAISTGIAPTTSPVDAIQMYSADVVAGNAAPHFRTENGAVVKVYQETTGVGAATFVQGSVNAVYEDSTFDGYTLKQIVKALRNQGLLA